MKNISDTLHLVIFDIAGTTVQDHGFVERAFLSVSQKYGLGLDAKWIKPRMGVHKLAVMREALDECGAGVDATPELLAKDFEDAIDLEVEIGAAPAIPGTPELLEDIQSAGVRIAFTTGFSRKTAETVLRGAGIKYSVLVASDEVTNGRPDPEIVYEAMRRSAVESVARVAVVGDTPSDLGSGMNAGAGMVIGIGHGTHAIEDLADHPHTHLAASNAALRELFVKRMPLPEREKVDG